ncbi:hypothetical protein TTHERM_00238970 (macronuclear) [Tetrahymena thermophila SB210]|uniref:Uncharacterized protein n=1 Tax=Tetrahymena thermophila (strain SB210) TaxID=312017 RepID=I7MMC3_TETTS|nr:hypothetical protein TTHERM_00238970 [Tetrahymena thermophila SB210]EAS04577.2 hypothetical protein TTHERM_00238970 [Tetrahymena thermophila SB210]|eukprot:XP_001024822.2 hypothetical protein TTHERM_00238970 [Tetrahymena thermophila SB210]
MAPMAQPSYEIYTILYVDFEYEQQKFLGYACTSNEWTKYDGSYSISKGDFISKCDDVGPSYDTQYNYRLRLLKVNKNEGEQINNQNRKRNLRKRGICTSPKKRGHVISILEKQEKGVIKILKID